MNLGGTNNRKGWRCGCCFQQLPPLTAFIPAVQKRGQGAGLREQGVKMGMKTLVVGLKPTLKKDVLRDT